MPDAGDPFLLLYTSGTTAAPKGVPHPYRTMLSNARLGAPEHGLDSRDRVLSAAPLSHLYGLYSLHCAWAVGACTVLLPAFTPDELASVVENQKPTALWTAPAHMAACRAAGLFDKHDWSSLKLAIVSGSSAPPELMRFLKEKLSACAVTQLWGMTELQAGLYTRPDDAPEVSAASSGRPSPGTEVRLSAEGELQVRGALLFAGYHENEEANRAAFTGDGWFRSGDLAQMDGAGNVAITGRTKDVINRGGVKFNPADVEMLLDSHPKILQSAIVPMPDPILGEKACAFVALRSPAVELSLEELVEYLLAEEHREDQAAGEAGGGRRDAAHPDPQDHQRKAQAAMRRVAILGGARIPFARSNGAYAEASNQDMLTAALRALVDKFSSEKREDRRSRRRRGDQALARLEPGARVDARRGLHPSTPAYDLQRACGTSLSAAAQLANRIALGEIDSRDRRRRRQHERHPARLQSGLRRIVLKSARGKIVRRKALNLARFAAARSQAGHAAHRRAAHRHVDGRALRGDGEGVEDRPPRAGRARAREPQECRRRVEGGLLRRSGLSVREPANATTTCAPTPRSRSWPR